MDSTASVTVFLISPSKHSFFVLGDLLQRKTLHVLIPLQA